MTGRKTDCKISFGLFDVTAKDDAAPALTDRHSWVSVANLKNEEKNAAKYGTLEWNQFLLDGSYKAFPGSRVGTYIKELWSLSMSDERGVFAAPPVLTLNFDEKHSSLGLTFIFHEPTYNWCKRIRVKWYNLPVNQTNKTLLGDKTFYPDGPEYFADCKVNNYRGIEITFLETCLPYRYMKLTDIDYGERIRFSGADILSANIVEETDPISSEVRINTLNFMVHSSDESFSLLNPKGKYAYLQRKQRVDVSGTINDRSYNMGTFYLEEPEADNENVISMSCIDLVGLLDQTTFMGGIYESISARSILNEIMESAGADAQYRWTIDNSLGQKSLSGWIPICTHREALQQVAFAVGGIVDCSRGRIMKIYSAPITAEKEIGYDQKITGHTVKQKPIVTSVAVTAHNYSRGIEEQELHNEKLVAGEHEIIFSSPMHSLKITGGTIVKSNANYAKIRVTTSDPVILTGEPFKDYTKVYRANLDDIPSNERKNDLQIDNATLVSNAIAQAVADRVLNYYQNRIQAAGSIILDGERVGSRVNLMSMGQTINGLVESLDIDLANGILAKATITGKAVE